MRLRKRHVAAALGATFILFCAIRYSLEWRREYASPYESLEQARDALAAHDVDGAIRFLDEALDRASMDDEELASVTLDELFMLDSSPPLPLADAAKLYRHRIALQQRNCKEQTWDLVLQKRVRTLGWSEADASAHYHMLHPGRELLEMAVARAETLGTFAAWEYGRSLGQDLKESGAVPTWAHVLRALANLKARETDGMDLVNYPVAPIMGWLRAALASRPEDAMLQRALQIGLAIAKIDENVADRSLPREDPLTEAIALSDAFAATYADNVPGQVNRIETRIRAAEMAAIVAEPSAQDLLNQFAAFCPSEANWREILRAARLQVRALRLQDSGSPEYAQGIANVRRMAGSLLERTPDAPDALHVLGTMYRQIRQEDDARDSFARAANSGILCTPTLRALAWDLSGGLAEMALVDMDLERWESGAGPTPADLDALVARIDRAALRLGDRAGEVLLARGRAALLATRDREAIGYLEDACRRVGKARPIGFLRLGLTLAKVGETGVAATRLEQLLRIPRLPAETDLLATRELASLALRNSTPDQAALRIMELTAHHPGDPHLRLARARALLHACLQRTLESNVRSHQLGEILDILREQVATGDEEGILLSAQAEALLGEGENPMAGIEAFCRKKPDHVRALLAWCWALRLRGDMAAEDKVVRDFALPRAAPPVAALLEQALRPVPEARRLLDPLLRLAFVADPAERQLGLFWIHWGLGDDQACAAALAALPAEAAARDSSVGARLAFLLDAGRTQEARALLASPPAAALPEWQRELWQGKLLLAVHDFDQANRVLERLTKRNPHLSEALALRGILAMQCERPGEALLHFRASLQANPMQPLALEGIVDISLAGRQPVQALAHLRKLVRVVSPCQPRVQAVFLDRLSTSGTAGGAVALRERLRRQSPWDRGNRRELALLHLQSRNLSAAEAILSELVAEQPSDVAMSLLLAQSLVAQGLRADARRVLARTIDDPRTLGDDPRSLEAADLLAEIGAEDEAQRLLARVTASSPRLAAAASAKHGNLLYAQGEWERAAAVYAACEETAERPDLVRRRAECLVRAGLFEEAQARLRRLAELVPDDPMVHVLGGELALARNDLEQARAACAAALKRDPGCATAFLLQARLAIRADGGFGDLDAAIRDLEKACIRDPGLLEARELLVRLLLERGRADEAAATLHMLVGARPEERRLKVALAHLLLELGNDGALASALKRWRAENPEEPLWWRIEGMHSARLGRQWEAAFAYEQHFAGTGDPRSLLAAVDAYLAAGFPENAEKLCQSSGDAAATSPEYLIATARLSPPEQTAEIRGLLTRAFACGQGEAALDLLLAHARKALPPRELLAWLEEVQAQRPSVPVALALADAAEAAGQPARASAVVKALAEEAEGQRRGELLARLAEAEYAAGQPAAAETVLRQALQAHPEHPALLNNAAHLALLGKGREPEAVRLARRAIAASADDRELHACALSTLGEALFRLRLYDQARDALGKALSIQDNAEDRLLLGRALLGSGRPEQGAAQLREARSMAVRDGNENLVKAIDSLL